MTFTDEQVKELLKPIEPARVGKDGKGFSHVEAWDIRKRMNQIFGFGGWSADVSEMVLVAEKETTTKQGKPAWYVVYRAQCTVTVGDSFSDGCQYTEWAAGDATNPTLADAHDQAIKTAESQAFKRACVNLGDQFGLSLYKNGSTEATVNDVVGREHMDSGIVMGMVEQFAAVASMNDLSNLAQEVTTLDLSDKDKTILRTAYAAAKERLETA